MLRKPLVLLTALAVIVASCSEKPASPRMQAEGQNVSVDYGAPSKRDRDIFGALVPFGETWRTGANEATTLTLKQDAYVGAAKLAAGSYSLWTKPGADQWNVIFNTQTGQWGTEHDPAKDIVIYQTAPEATAETVEQMRFTVQPVEGGEHLVLEWDKTKIQIPFLAQPPAAPTDSTATDSTAAPEGEPAPAE